MKYKLQKFLEWLFLNEASIFQLPDLKSHKKLFWLHWIQWHIAFYLPGTDFLIQFPKHGHAVFYLIRKTNIKNEIHNQHLFQHFHIKMVRCTLSKEAIRDLEERIIVDVEVHEPPHFETTGIAFVQLDFRDLTSFSKYDVMSYAETVSSFQTPSLPIVFVKLRQTNFLNDSSLTRYCEFDYYMESLNRNAK